LQFRSKFQQYQKIWWSEHWETCELGWKSVYAMMGNILVTCRSKWNKQRWNKMIFNVHSFCNNKLKIKIKFHCFIYFWKSSGSLATPCIYYLYRPIIKGYSRSTLHQHERLWKLTNISEKLRDMFVKYYSPAGHLVVDEVTVLFKRYLGRI
jgi:hypothetical protein